MKIKTLLKLIDKTNIDCSKNPLIFMQADKPYRSVINFAGFLKNKIILSASYKVPYTPALNIEIFIDFIKVYKNYEIYIREYGYSELSSIKTVVKTSDDALILKI